MNKDNVKNLLDAVAGVVQCESLSETQLIEITTQHLKLVKKRRLEEFFDRRFKTMSLKSVDAIVAVLATYQDVENEIGKEQEENNEESEAEGINTGVGQLTAEAGLGDNPSTDDLVRAATTVTKIPIRSGRGSGKPQAIKTSKAVGNEEF